VLTYFEQDPGTGRTAVPAEWCAAQYDLTRREGAPEELSGSGLSAGVEPVATGGRIRRKLPLTQGPREGGQERPRASSTVIKPEESTPIRSKIRSGQDAPPQRP